MPSRALSGRDPQNGKNGFSITHGFTVIEMLIAVAVLAIITSLALPSYRALLEKRRVTSGAEQIMAFLSSAQMESVKRNQFVAVNLEFNGGEWCLGMKDGDNWRPDDISEVDCDCTEDITHPNACILNSNGDDELRVLRFDSINYPEVLAASTDFGGDDKIVVYDPVRGLIGAWSDETADIELISPDQETYALNIGLTPTGRVDICSDDSRATYSVPGYKECP